MKLLERENIVVPKGARMPDARPAVARPSVAVRARVVTRPVPRRTASLEAFCGRIVIFGSVMGMTYVGSTLAGYVVLERVRQSARHGEQRAAFSRTQAREARASIEALTNPAALRAWADSHDFAAPTPPIVTPEASGYVARR